MDETTENKIKQLITKRSGNFRRTTFQKIYFIVAIIASIISFILFVISFIKTLINQFTHEVSVYNLMQTFNGISKENAELIINRLISPSDYAITAALLTISFLFARIAWLRNKIINRNLYIKELEDLISK
jgi:hypothetical protein